MAANFFTMTPYSTWAMPKLDWDLINKAGATQQVRGEKAEQKYSDFTSLYDSLKLHEKYNESYQNWRTKTDEELDALINNYGGKLGTTGFNRDLDKLIGSKKNDPWIKNAIQSSENAKLYEENILRNPDIKSYNDPNAETYLGWLEDKTPTFKYKGFYKDSPPEDWFATNASKFPAAKWTEIAEWGKHGMKTIQHDAKNAADIERRFNEMKDQFAKTPAGQQFQRMLDAGEFGSLTYDQAFGIYADAAAGAVSYDNWSATASQDINKQAAEQIRQFEENKKIQKQQLEQTRKYQQGMLRVAQQNAETNATEVDAKIEQGYFTKSSTSGGITDAAVDELLLPIVRSARSDPQKFENWKNGEAGGKYETRISFGTTGGGTLKTKLEQNVMSGSTTLTTKTGKQISTAILDGVMKAYDSKSELQAVDNITLVKTEDGAEARVNFTTPVYTRERAKKIIEGYNDKKPAIKLTIEDFEKTASGDYILKVEGKDEAVSGYFNDWSQSPTIGTGRSQVPNPLYTPLTVPAQQNAVPPHVSTSNYPISQTTSNSQQTNQTNTDVTGTAIPSDTAKAITNTGLPVNQAAVATNNKEIDLHLERSGFVVRHLDKDDFFSLETEFNKSIGSGGLEVALHYNKVADKFIEPQIFVQDRETEKTIAEVYLNTINLAKYNEQSNKKHRELPAIKLDKDTDFSKLFKASEFIAINNNIMAGFVENKSGQRIEIKFPNNGVGILEPNTRAVVTFEESANGQESYGVYPVPGRSLMESTSKTAEVKRGVIKNFTHFLEALSNSIN